MNKRLMLATLVAISGNPAMAEDAIRRHGSAGGMSPVEFEKRYALSGN